MTFTVVVEPEAKADLLRLYEYLLERAEYVEDLDVADRALHAIEAGLGALERTPFLFRKAEGERSGLRRELVIPSGASGYVVKYEVASPRLVVVLAVRHRHEADYRRERPSPDCRTASPGRWPRRAAAPRDPRAACRFPSVR